jgi:uncharacterized membrane protein YhaH (DUF805 family)
MSTRAGEKAGWSVGWAGGFLWVGILAVVFLVQGNTLAGVGGLVLVAVAAAAIGAFAPWRHPDTRYWRLMLPLYALLGLAAAWAVMAFGAGLEEAGLTGWSLLVFLPLLIPFASVGGRRWRDGGGSG